MLNTPMMLDLPSNPAKGVSLSSFKKMRFEEISSWFNDSDSSLFQFKYFSSLSMKRQILCLVQDISWNVFKIINQEFYRNKLGFITKTPDMSLGIENAPIFSFQASRLQLQFEAKDDKINIFETIKTNTEQEIRLWVGEYPCDCSDEENVKNTILKLESEFNKGIRKKTLDTKDYDVFTNVFNNMPMSSVTTLDGSFGIDLKDFVTDIYANNSHFKSQPKNIYKDTLERLNKLATYHISHSRQDENGRIIAAGTKYFFELDIIPIDNEHFNSSGRTINTIKVSDSVSDFDWSNYSVKDFENLHLKFSPSNSMKELWTEGMHSAIISKAYKQVSDHKGRFIIQFLHAERMKCYPELSKKLPLSYIKTKMRYAKNTSERVKKEMAEEMDKFKGQYVIKDYHFERGYLCLEFLPLSKEECIIYKIPYDDSNDKNILI